MKRTYSVKGRTIDLDVDEDAVAVRFKTSSPNSARAKAASGSRFEDFSNRLELSHENFVILNLQGADNKAARFGAATSELVDNAAVERVAQVFKSGDKRLLATDRLIVGFKPDAAHVEDVLNKYNLETVEEFGETERVVRVQPNIDPIDVVNEISAEESIDYAEPDFVIIGKHLARRSPPEPQAGTTKGAAISQPTDPLLEDQYAVYITEADLAWNYAGGSPEIRIAILDEGVDILHPDLEDAVVGMYDATDDDQWQQPNAWDAHGTACAGLAAAIHWNGEGIMGVGGGCSLLAVRIAYSETPGGGWVTTNNWIRRAIDWARENRADVLSNSWGGGAYNQSIVNAFERARTQGRNGKGAVIVVAAATKVARFRFPVLCRTY